MGTNLASGPLLVPARPCLAWRTLLVCALCFGVTGSASADVRSFRPDASSTRTLKFVLHGVKPADIRAGYLVSSGRRNRLPLSLVRRAARSGVLRVRAQRPLYRLVARTASKATRLELVVARAPAPSGIALLADGFESLTVGLPWSEGETHGPWRLGFNGYGTVGIEQDGSKVLAQAPRPSQNADETHAALVTSVAAFGDLDLTARVRTVAQLRTPTPNPWEVAWLLWNYTDNTHFYYVLLRPTGWELGKEDPAYPGAQRFLATGSTPSFPIGPWHTIRVRQVANSITIWVNGTLLTTFTDTEKPYLRGSLGMYTEDAVAHFDDVSVSQPERLR